MKEILCAPRGGYFQRFVFNKRKKATELAHSWGAFCFMGMQIAFMEQ
ncbi:MAG: hypothetical protein L3J30_03145 [Marinosulfonomonas sp.]|nr:hypothetical protein [Marinosulfonomonas sp.]